MRALKYLLCLSIVVILSGCATTTHVRTDLSFTPKRAKLSKTVLLEVPQETRDYVAEAKYGWQAFRIPVGQGVEANALAAFGSVIEKVSHRTARLKYQLRQEQASDSGPSHSPRTPSKSHSSAMSRLPTGSSCGQLMPRQKPQKERPLVSSVGHSATRPIPLRYEMQLLMLCNRHFRKWLMTSTKPRHRHSEVDWNL